MELAYASISYETMLEIMNCSWWVLPLTLACIMGLQFRIIGYIPYALLLVMWIVFPIFDLVVFPATLYRHVETYSPPFENFIVKDPGNYTANITSSTPKDCKLVIKRNGEFLIRGGFYNPGSPGKEKISMSNFWPDNEVTRGAFTSRFIPQLQKLFSRIKTNNTCFITEFKITKKNIELNTTLARSISSIELYQSPFRSGKAQPPSYWILGLLFNPIYIGFIFILLIWTIRKRKKYKRFPPPKFMW